ncbi:coiled-coil domain-containing protein 83 isoform X1 [Arapaima gigas]
MAQESLAQGAAFISFQIQLRRKEMEDFQQEVSELEEKKQKQAKVNMQLKAEQMKQVKRLLQELKEQEQRLEQEEVLDKARLEQAFENNVQLARDEERRMRELHNDLTALEEQLLALQAEKQVWYNYKTVGSKEHQQQIQRLEADLVVMEESFQQMSGGIQRLQDDTFREIQKKTVSLIDEKRSLAAEARRAIKQLDNVSQWEIEDNEWLKREHDVYKEEVSLLDEAVQKLEKENLELVNEVFQSRLSFASRNTFISQDAALEESNLWMTEIRTETVALTEESETSDSPETPPDRAAEAGKMPSWTRDLKGDETDSCIPTTQRPTGPTPWEPSVSLNDCQNTTEQDALHLGPREEELVIVGRAVPLHPSLADAVTSAAGIQQKWPLTTSIIHGRFK